MVEQGKSARLTVEQMRRAIQKIKELIAELQALDVSITKERGEERFELLEKRIDATLAALFGRDTIEYDRFRIETLDTAKIHMMYEIPLYEVKEGYVRGIDQAVSNLRGVIELFGEKVLESRDNPESQVTEAFAGRSLHPVIEQATAESFSAGKCGDAIYDACNALEKELRKRYDNGEPGGRKLVELALNAKNPVVWLNDLGAELGQEEQRALLFLLAGALITGSSSEARTWIGADSDRALDFVSLLSFLARCLDQKRENAVSAI